MKPRRPFLFILVGFLSSLSWFSCSSTDSKFGMVEMFHGRPKNIRMIPRAVLGNLPSGPFPSQIPKGILVVDTGCDYQGETSLTYLTNLLERYTQKEGFGDLPFHYFIDLEGKIFAGRNVITPAEIHVGDPFTLRRSHTSEKDVLMARLDQKRNPTLPIDGYIVIAFLGDYDTQFVNPKQEKSFFQLCAQLVYEHNIPLENIRGLRSLHPQTQNPGFYLNNYFQPSILNKNIPPPPGQHRFLLPPVSPAR